MRILNYLKNKIIFPRKLDEKLLNKIICDLKQEVNAYHAGGSYMPKSTRPERTRQEIGDTYWGAFSFAEKDIKLLKGNNVSNKISVPMAEIYDHDTAEIMRKFCRSTVAKIIMRMLPYIPIFHLNYLTVFFHYDFCLPNVDYTRRIYSVTIYMNQLRSLRIKDLNEENIRNYFEMENSQIKGVFSPWNRPDVNEMV